MNDCMKAKALEISERKLIKLGWKFTVEDVGREAAKMIKALDAELLKLPVQD